MSVHREKSCYDVLGLQKNATQEEIKKAFRTLASIYHPDRYKGSDCAERMSEINVAYEILADEKKRKEYDTTGKVGRASEMAAQARQQLYSLVAQIFEQTELVDIVPEIKKSVAKHKLEMRDKIREIKNSIKRVEKAKKSLKPKTKKGDGFLEVVMENRLDMENKRLEAAAKHLEVVDEVMRLVDDYEGEFMEVAEVEMGGNFMHIRTSPSW